MTNIENFDNVDKHCFEKQNFEIDKNCNLMTINIDTKIENHERQIIEKNRFIVHDFVY